jgi:hypothetical protein
LTTLSLIIFLSAAAFGQFGDLPRPKIIVEKRPPNVRFKIREHSELTSTAVLQGRNIRKYDRGGHFDCREWAPPDDTRGTCDDRKARDFIWRHWNDKKRGYLRITNNTVDAYSTTHIFIEPDKKGAWHIAWRVAYVALAPPGRSGLDNYTDLDTVERVEGKRLDDWCIVIKGRSGEIFSRFPE